MNYREVTGHRAHRAQLRTGGHPAAVLPVVGLQAPADTQLASYHGKSNVELPGAAGAGLVEVLVLALVAVVARLVALPAVADISVVVVCLLPAQTVSPRP